jgi:glycosidase
MGADKQQALQVTFDRRLRTEFHGSKVTSDTGLLAYRELDEALGLTDRGGNLLNDWRTGQNAVNWTRLSCHDFVDNQVRLQLFVLAYNPGNFLRQAVLPRAVRHWTLTTLREKLIKIGAKVVRHARGGGVSGGRGGGPTGTVPGHSGVDWKAEVVHPGVRLTTIGFKQEGGHAFVGAFCLDSIGGPLVGLQLSESQPGAGQILCRQAANWLEITVRRGILATSRVNTNRLVVDSGRMGNVGVNRFYSLRGYPRSQAGAQLRTCWVKALLALLVVSLATVRQAASYYPSPTDWRNESIYQILTDRFYDGNPSNDNAEAYHGSPYDPTSSTGINGGDFKGIQDKLGYIQSLGATAIWISPIPLNSGDNSAYHGYHAQDYYTLAPHWGTMTDLSNMVQAAHALGIKVILDIVVNHTAKLLTSTDAGWPNYIAPPGGYHLSYISTANEEAFPFNPTNVTPPLITTLFHTNGNIGNYSYPSATQEVVLGQLDYLDDLTTETTYVRTNMMNIYTNWVGLGDFDAFRIDTAIEVDFGFWQYWCPQLHQYGASIGKSNFFMFGEADSSVEQQIGSYTGTEGGGPFKYDAMLDYALYFNCVNQVFATASGNTGLILTHYNDVAAYYDSNSWYRLVTFLDNHDQPRFLSNSGATTNSLTVGLQFLYTSRGIPCLYYGTEQGFEGDNNNEDNREDMFAGGWQPQVPVTGDNFNETSPLFQQVARLNNFRRLYPALRTGVQNNLWSTSSGPGLFAYSRVLSNEEVFVAFNTASTSQTLTNRPTTYSPSTVLVNLLNTNDTIKVISGTGTNEMPLITVPAMTTKIYIAQSLMLPLNPVVTNQSPAHAATGVSPSTSIVLQFSKPMNTNSVQSAFSVTPATCMCTNSGSLVVCSTQSPPGTPATPGAFTWDALQDTMTFTPSGGWSPTTTNLVHLATNAVDSVSGNSFYGPFDTYFVTTSNTVLSCEISGPNAVCANSSSLAYTALANMLISSVDWAISGNGTIIGPTNGASVVVNAGGSGSFTLAATVATSNSVNICEQVVTIDPSLLAYWTFDEGTGSIANDSSGNGNTGTVVFDISDGGEGYWTLNGMVNGALYFDGEFTQVVVSNSPSLNPNNGITIAAWVNAANWSGTPRILEKGLSDNQYALFINLSTQLEFLVASVSNGIVAVSPPSAGAWHHLAGTYDGSWMSLYIDGQLATQQIASGAMPVATDPLVIGDKPDGNLYDAFNGTLDDVRIYCGTLTAVQVAQLYNFDSVGDGVANWWRLQYFGSSSSTNAASCAGCDDDGTGQNNSFKYAAGLNPTNPASLFQLTIATATNQPDGENLQFLPMVGGRTYTPQFNTSLVNGAWLPLTTYTGLSTNGNQVTITDTNPIPPQEFYRIDISLP